MGPSYSQSSFRVSTFSPLLRSKGDSTVEGCPPVTRQQETAEAGDLAAAPNEEKENPLEFSSGCECAV